MLLVPLVFAYQVECIPRGGRNPRTLRFLDRTVVGIDEYGPDEAPIGYRTTMEIPAGLDATRLAGERCLRVLRRRSWGEPVDLATWMEELAAEAGDHTQIERRRIVPDVLGLRPVAGLREPSEGEEIRAPDHPYPEECLWPARRIGEVPMRRVVESRHDAALAAIATAARRLAVVDGVPHVEKGEPVWRLRLVGLPDGRTQSVKLAIESYGDVMRDLAVRRASLVPFADYRLFRIDRTVDLLAEIAELERTGTRDGVDDVRRVVAEAVVEISPQARPALDLASGMIADLASRTWRLAAEIASREDTRTGLFRSFADVVAESSPPPAGGHAVEIADWLQDFVARTEDGSVRRPPDGHLTRHLTAVRAAVRALRRDLDAGLVARPGLDASEDDAIGSLA